MASPAVASVAEFAGTTAATSHAVTLPGSVAAGDLLVMLLGSNENTANFAVSGWTRVPLDSLAGLAYPSNITGGQGTMDAFYKVSAGGEGATQTVTCVSSRISAITYRITGAATTGNIIQVSDVQSSGVTANPSAPTSNPTGGSKDYLFIVFTAQAGEEADDDTWANSPPTSFTPSPPRQKTTGTAGAASANCSICSAERALTAASLTPGGNWSLDTSTASIQTTMAVHPPTAVFAPPPRSRYPYQMPHIRM